MDKEMMQVIYGFKQDVLAAVNEVSTRVTRVETKLDKYNAVREAAYQAREQAEDNCEKIAELKDSHKWSTRTGIGALLGLIGKIIYDTILGR